MENNSFASLANSDIYITELSCVEYQWSGNTRDEYQNGIDQNIIFFTVGESTRIKLSDGEEAVANGASVIFVSKNTPYNSESSLNEGEGYTACVKFNITDKTGKEIKISDRYLCWENVNKDFYTHIFKNVIKAYISVNSNGFSVKSAFYKLLAELVTSLQQENHLRDGFEDLLPAIRYMESNLGKRATTDELAKMCFLSESHFRKRFKEYTGGVSLTEYRNKMRIDKARELMVSPMWTTTLIAEVLGFYDISHFSRVYKKYTGESISDKNKA